MASISTAPSGLAPELLEFISKKLRCIDYVAFRSAAPAVRFARLLMLPFDREAGAISFCSFSDDEISSFPLPEVGDEVLCGASHGWLAFVDAAASVLLLNPPKFTTARVQLPPADERMALASQERVIKKANRWFPTQ